MSITGEHIKIFQYINYEKENPPLTITDYFCKKLEDAESKHVADYRDMELSILGQSLNSQS